MGWSACYCGKNWGDNEQLHAKNCTVIKKLKIEYEMHINSAKEIKNQLRRKAYQVSKI